MKVRRMLKTTVRAAKLRHRKQRQLFPYVRIARMWEQQDKTIAQIARAIGRVDNHNPKDSCHSVRNAKRHLFRAHLGVVNG